MSLLKQALRGGLSGRHARDGGGRTPIVIVGAAGPLGAAVLEQVLAAGHWSPVTALVTQPIEVALRGLLAAQVPHDLGAQAHLPAAADTAIVVFDRERSLHGREAAFLRPRPDQLPALAAWLHAQGLRRLMLVLPHAPALLPQALKAGLATLDEQAVAALGFDQLVIVRPARTGAADAFSDPALSGANAALARLAHGILAQLKWMVPQRDQPLRAAKVAAFVVALAHALPTATPGLRVAPPELLWDWAQPDGGDAVLQGWLNQGRWAPAALPAQRW